MKDINEIIKLLISRNDKGEKPITLLAVCPNSSAVLEAAVNTAFRNRSLMLFAATLNQVDIESSYTGWTPSDFVQQIEFLAEKYSFEIPLYPCLDHGGPWLKDQHTLEKLPYHETMDKVKNSIEACILAGYKLLHIDPTVDRSLSSGQTLPLEVVVNRTVELINHAENIRSKNQLPRIAYEVGTEEVHGGLVDISRFSDFLFMIKNQLTARNLEECWPCLFVAQIGTDLHTTQFDSQAAGNLYKILAPTGSLAKGHYTDWVKNPEDYPRMGMGAANVGPEFSAEEYIALTELEKMEKEVITKVVNQPSHFIETLQHTVVESGRWKKWLLPGEAGMEFDELSPERKDWLIKTGSRYKWTDKRVNKARKTLYNNLSHQKINPHRFVIDRISRAMEKYVSAFNLQNSIDILT
jgi:tagatose-1,6-bisphosphate aldolase non-catalytic subunit AgaZ/GatZ